MSSHQHLTVPLPVVVTMHGMFCVVWQNGRRTNRYFPDSGRMPGRRLSGQPHANVRGVRSGEIVSCLNDRHANITHEELS